jgi:DNA-binding GntR family transcriptional regulator
MDKDERTGALRFQTKADAAHAELKRRILDGSLPPASALNQEQVALEFGVSTTPLREAIRRLASEGLVEYTAHKEVVVISIQDEDLVNIYEVREQLDALAARFAAERHVPAEARAIRVARTALIARRPGDPLVLNRRFHRSIYSASHNPLLVQILEGLWDRGDRHRRLLHTMALTPDVVADHLVLADAVLERNGELAATVMARHVHKSMQAIRDRAREKVQA